MGKKMEIAAELDKPGNLTSLSDVNQFIMAVAIAL